VDSELRGATMQDMCVERTDLHADLFETKQLVPANKLSRVVKLRAGSKMNVKSSI